MVVLGLLGFSMVPWLWGIDGEFRAKASVFGLFLLLPCQMVVVVGSGDECAVCVLCDLSLKCDWVFKM